MTSYRTYTAEQRQAMKEHGNNFYVFGEYFDVEVKYAFDADGIISGWAYHAPFEAFYITDEGKQWFAAALKPSVEHLKSVLHASIDRMKAN
jgi:hypothetical protein